MKIFDGHFHIESVGMGDLESMVLAGVRYAVALSHDFTRMSTIESCLDYYDRLFRVERTRARQAGMQLWIGLGIHPGAIPSDIYELLDQFPELLGQEGVVAIGEVGIMDPGDRRQRDVLRAQLELAKATNTPIVVGTPQDHKKRAFNRLMQILEGADIDPELVLLDDLDPNLSKEALEVGYWVGVSLWPQFPFVQPANLTQAFKFEEYPYDKLIVSSDLDSWATDPLLLPKLVLTMEREGVPKDVIKQVFFENPVRFYRLELGQE